MFYYIEVKTNTCSFHSKVSSEKSPFFKFTCDTYHDKFSALEGVMVGNMCLGKSPSQFVVNRKRALTKRVQDPDTYRRGTRYWVVIRQYSIYTVCICNCKQVLLQVYIFDK